jgi:hypothetical protein
MIIQQVITWTLAGAFIFTVTITCLGMIGIVKFPNKEHLNKLFYVIIIEVAIASVGVFTGNLRVYNISPPPPIISDVPSDPVTSMPAGIQAGEMLLGANASDPSSIPSPAPAPKALSFSQIQPGMVINLVPKDEDESIAFNLYDDKPSGLFGKFGKKIGIVAETDKLTVLETYVTGTKKYKWIRVSFIKNGSPVIGWFSWENILTSTYEIG